MKSKNQLMLAGILASALLTGCGSGGGGDSIPTSVAISQSVSALFSFMNNLITTSTNETGDPIDINGLTLATDDTAEPTPLN